jgi:hypothetical protein
MKQYGREVGVLAVQLRTIGGDKNAEWKFIDHDQDTIRLELVRDKDRYILVDKGALRLVANAFSELAQELSG